MVLAINSIENSNSKVSVFMTALGILIHLAIGRSESKIPHNLRSVVNAALDDDNRHFIG
jgi:hypothetical protein